MAAFWKSLQNFTVQKKILPVQEMIANTRLQGEQTVYFPKLPTSRIGLLTVIKLLTAQPDDSSLYRQSNDFTEMAQQEKPNVTP